MIFQLGEACRSVIGILDENGTIIVCSELSMIGETRIGIMGQLSGRDEVVCAEGYSYLGVTATRADERVVFARGTDAHAEHIVRMVGVTLSGMRQFYDERYDKTNFIKNVVMDNVLPGDIYAKAREMHFSTDVRRVVLLVRINSGGNISVFEVVSGLFPDHQKDFVFNISETDIVIVKEVKAGIDQRDVEKLAGSIIDVLEGEHYVNSIVGIGMVVGGINELASSFKEAQVALEVGKVFDTAHQIISYDNLGIARLIYQLPTTLCEMFLKEVFKKGSIESLDQETLFTIQRFFENNLNVSETSRGLFVHRNTLVYRLEKIKKLTGLDLRQFDHAIIFKVALMVKKYLDANPIKY